MKKSNKNRILYFFIFLFLVSIVSAGWIRPINFLKLTGDGQIVDQEVTFNQPVYFLDDITVVDVDSMSVNESIELFDRTGTVKIRLNASGDTVFNNGDVSIDGNFAVRNSNAHGIIKFSTTGGSLDINNTWNMGLNRNSGRLTFTSEYSGTTPLKFGASALNNLLRIGTVHKDQVDINSDKVIINGSTGDMVLAGGLSINKNLDVIGTIQAGGNISGEGFYGELWEYNSNATSRLFEILLGNIYYNLTGLGEGDTNGFIYETGIQTEGGSRLITTKAGKYSIHASVSFEGTVNKELYAFTIGKNYMPNSPRKCYSRRYVSSQSVVGSISANCFMDLQVGDVVNMLIEDEEVGAGHDMRIHAVNMNLVRIGN